MSIVGIGLGLLGGGGAIGLALHFFAPGVVETIGAVLKRIPPKMWIAIAVAAALAVGYFVHQRTAHAAIAAAYAGGKADDDAAWRKRLAEEHAAALRWKAQAETAQANISREIGARHDQDLHRIDDRAGDQRLRGPGHASAPACGGHVDPAGLPGGAGGREAPARPADSGLAGLPPAEPMAIVPWNDLVDRARDADSWRSEALTWREWHAREAALNAKQREAIPETRPSKAEGTPR